MSARVIRYRTKPECADENQQLVERVFAELDEMGATGFSYATFRLDDGVSFVHVVVEDEGADAAVSLAAVPAFQAFQAGISRAVRGAAGRGRRDARRRPPHAAGRLRLTASRARVAPSDRI